MKTEQTIKVFYNKNQSISRGIASSPSRSPEKPKLLLNYLENRDLLRHFSFHSDFPPFTDEDFLIAHTQEYVSAFFNGEHPLCSTNCLSWSPELAESTRWTNSSLYHAIRHSVENPENICFSPTSGFHHASPGQGAGFCSFSGQVIASVKIYREFGLRGAYLDLDGHFGNSIEDSRVFVRDLNKAVPPGFNMNPEGKHQEYIQDLEFCLRMLSAAIDRKEIDYLVWCKGADSHEDDDLGYQCNTQEWVTCSKMFYQWVSELTRHREKPFPISLSLFGGYRKDDYNSVLSLHAADLVLCLNTLCGTNIQYQTEVKSQGSQYCI